MADNPFAAELAKRESPKATNPFSAELQKRGGLSDEQRADIAQYAPGVAESDYISPILSGEATRGFNKGISRYIEFPESLVGAAIDLIHGKEPHMQGQPIPLTNWLRSDPVPAEQKAPGQRFWNRTMETVGASTPYAFMGMAGAPALSTADAAVGTEVGAMPEQAGVIRSAMGELGRSIQANPVQAGAGEGIGAITSGVGAGAVAAVAPGHPEAEGYAEMALPLSLAAMSGVGNKLASSFKATFSREENERIAQQVLSQAMGREIGPEEAQQITKALALRQQIPGFNPSLGESIWNTGPGEDLLASQRALEASGNAAERGAARERYQNNLESIRNYGDAYSRENFGGGPDKSPSEIVDTLNGKVDEIRVPTQQALSDVDAQQGQLAQGLPENVQLQSGQTLRARENEMLETARAGMKAMAQRLGIDDTKLVLPFNIFRAQVKKDFSPGRFENMNSRPEVLDQVIGDKNDMVSFDQLMELRTRVGSDLRTALADGQDGTVRQLTMFRNRLDNFIANAPAQFGMDPSLGPAWDFFRSSYKNNIVDRFKQGAAYKVRETNEQNFYQTPDEKVASTFFKSPSGARQFTTTFGEDAESMAAMKDAILDDLRKSVVRDGRVNPILYEGWQRRNTAALNELPEQVRSAVQDVGTVSKQLETRATILQARLNKIQDQILTKRLNDVNEFGRDPGAFVDEVMGNPVMMKQTIDHLRGSNDALQSFRRLVWNRARDMGTDDLGKLLENPAIKQLYSEDHLQALRNIYDAAEMSGSAGKMAGQPYELNPNAGIRQQTGQSVESIVAKLWAVETGRVGKPWAVVNLLGSTLRAQRRAAVERLFRQALYSPQIAKNMAESLIDRSPVAPSAMKLRSYLFNAGYDMGATKPVENAASDAAAVAKTAGQNVSNFLSP